MELIKDLISSEQCISLHKDLPVFIGFFIKQFKKGIKSVG